MFKVYRIQWEDGKKRPSKLLKFYFHIKRTRKGCYHRAIAVGDFPRIDGVNQDYDQYVKNSNKLEVARRAKATLVPGGAAVMEKWIGRHVLCKLWDRLAALPFVDMQMISERCPFSYDREPHHEDLIEPEDVFN